MVAALTALAGSAAAAPASLPPPGQRDSHDAWAREVKAAEERAFRAALANYDRARAHAPEDAVSAVERCKLLGALTHRDDEGDALDEDDQRRADLYAACLDELDAHFPESPAVRVYRLDDKWGDEALAFGRRLLSDRKLALGDRDRAHVYERLARVLSSQKHAREAYEYATLALDYDPSLDLGIIVATELLDEGRPSEAVVALSAHGEESSYQLVRKARLLLDANAPERAAWLMRVALARKAYFDPSTAADILERTGRASEARKKLDETKSTRNRHATLAHLFESDLAGHDAEAAARSYQALRDLGWRADPFEGYRLALARKFPRAHWRARDWLGLLRLAGMLFLFALVPLGWVLPIHYWSLWRRLRGPLVVQPTMATRWRFVHVWLAGATFLVIQSLLLVVFCYAEASGWLQTPAEKQVTPPLALAKYGLWNAALLVIVLGLLFVRRGERKLFGPGNWSVRRSLGGAALAMGILVGLLVAVGLLGKLLSSLHGAHPAALGIEELIAALRSQYGIAAVVLVAVVVAPITEELVFRSIMLDVFARFMPFVVANALQALLFAAAHAELTRFPYLFALGFLAGSLRRRSGGLLPCILLHMLNNGLVLLLSLSTPVAPAAKPATTHQAAPAFKASDELMACVRATPGLEDAPPSAFENLVGGKALQVLNNVAWTIAIDAKATPACLRQAEAAVNGALRAMPEMPNVLDTKATVYFRLHRDAEAIDLERIALGKTNNGTFASQLGRFLAASPGPTLLGDDGSAPPKIVLEPRAPTEAETVRLELGDRFHDGVAVYARVSNGNGPVGLFYALVGRDHPGVYELKLPENDLTRDPSLRFQLALVDGRGCEHCAHDQWSWQLQPHDRSVDAYPR